MEKGERMPEPSLSVLVGMTPSVRTMFGDTSLRRLEAPHPGVRVCIIEDTESCAALLPEADGALVRGTYQIPASARHPGARRRSPSSSA